MGATKPTRFSSNKKKIKRQVEGKTPLDLERRLLELQMLRKRLRVARCGTLALSSSGRVDLFISSSIGDRNSQ
jgi:hypothetical protein